ncbi:MAG: hypothetical protein ACTSUE_13750 [Promethearchaeota archaeon]
MEEDGSVVVMKNVIYEDQTPENNNTILMYLASIFYKQTDVKSNKWDTLEKADKYHQEQYVFFRELMKMPFCCYDPCLIKKEIVETVFVKFALPDIMHYALSNKHSQMHLTFEFCGIVYKHVLEAMRNDIWTTDVITAKIALNTLLPITAKCMEIAMKNDIDVYEDEKHQNVIHAKNQDLLVNIFVLSLVTVNIEKDGFIEPTTPSPSELKSENENDDNNVNTSQDDGHTTNVNDTLTVLMDGEVFTITDMVKRFSTL